MRHGTSRSLSVAWSILLLMLAACAPSSGTAEPNGASASVVAEAVSATLTARPTPLASRTAASPTPSCTLTRLPTLTPLPPSPTPNVSTTSPGPSRTSEPTPSRKRSDGPSHTPTSTHAHTPTSTSPNTATPSSEARVAVWQQEITLQTYGWHDALVPTEPGDPVYPYPRLNFDAVTPPIPRTYQAIVLQNQYVNLVILPELGGRLLRWTDRVTGRQLFYANPVIKPTRWGYRGWWLASGGMEWAFPTEEHGLNEYRPWQYTVLWDGVRVWDTDDRTGMTIEITIRLDSEHSFFTLTPCITNSTGELQQVQFWANAMLTLSDSNRPSPGLTFILPDDLVTVHATADESLPRPGAQMSWPVHNGRDFSRHSEWHRYLGVFADPAQAGFFGAYDQQADQGIVRVFPHQVATGAKIFCLGDLSSDLWTDDGSRYVELWAGLTPTFWDYQALAPGAVVSWTERWYPVSGIAGYNWANEQAAIRLLPSGDSAEIAVVTTHAMDGTIVLRRDGTEVQRWNVFIAPDQPFRAIGGPASDGDWGVQVLAADSIIAQMGP